MIITRWSDEVTLIAPKPPASGSDNDTNENGFPVGMPEVSRKVFCNKKSVGRSEFYRSQQNGQLARFVLEVHAEEYNGERAAILADVRYTILRTYQTEKSKGEIIELTLSDIVANTGG